MYIPDAAATLSNPTRLVNGRERLETVSLLGEATHSDRLPHLVDVHPVTGDKYLRAIRIAVLVVVLDLLPDGPVRQTHDGVTTPLGRPRG